MEFNRYSNVGGLHILHILAPLVGRRYPMHGFQPLAVGKKGEEWIFGSTLRDARMLGKKWKSSKVTQLSMELDYIQIGIQ